MKEKHCPSIVKNSLILLNILLVFAVSISILSSKVFADSSETINFQGKIVRNDTGYEGLNVFAGYPTCVVDGDSNDTCDFQVKYYNDSVGGDLLLTETYTNVEIGQYAGAFSLSLGSDTSPTAGTYSSLDAAIIGEDDMYVELLFDPTGASSFTEVFSRMSVQATAYAVKAKYASEANTAFQFDSAADDTGYTSPVAGMVYYDSDETVLKMYNGSSWQDLTTGSGGSSLFTDSGDFTFLTSLTDHFVLGASSYTAIGTSTYDTYIDTNISSMPSLSFDMGAERLTLSGSQSRSGLTVYSDYSSTSAWPLVSFKAEYSGFSNTVLELTQDGTGDLITAKSGSTEVFRVDNNGAIYLNRYSSFTGTTTDRLYNVDGTLYWDGSALGSGSALWTDGGTYTYLTGTSDDVVIGGDSPASAKFFFDVSTGNFGIGTSTPGSKLEIAGASSVISNTTGDITLSADDSVIIKANDTEADNLLELQDSTGTVLGLINQNGYATFGDSTGNDNAILTIGANTSSVAQINLASSTGTDVLSPDEGDMWYNGTELYFYDGTDSINLLEGKGGALYSETSLVSNGSYLEVIHGDNTYEVLADGWVCVGGSDTPACTGGEWRNIKNSGLTIGHYLSNIWADADDDGVIRSDIRLTDIELSPGIDVGTGADGDITVSSSTNINTTSLISGRSCADGGDAVNYNIVAFNGSGTEATLSTTPSTGCLAVGDEVLVINLQGTYTAYDNTGNYETLEIESISGTTIHFKEPKIKYYGDNTTDDSNLGTSTGTQRVMLQRVPNYNDVTVNSSINFYPSAWNGSKGGVLFFRANGNVSVSGTLHADGLGYRNGAGAVANSNAYGGDGAEAFCGYGGGDGAIRYANGDDNYCGGGGGAGSDDRQNPLELNYGGDGSDNLGGSGGGGGGAVSSYEARGGGGSGGGYGTYALGGQGGYSGSDGGDNISGDGGNNTASYYSYSRAGGGGGGGTYGEETLENKIMFGSGGGGGGGAAQNGGSGYTSSGGNGGNGGGVIYVSANSISVSGSISSDGVNGSSGGTTGTFYSGSGGGGAGGSVALSAKSLGLGVSLVSATGGLGATANYDGGDGGDGRIAIYYADSITGTTANASVTNSYIAGYNSYGVYHSPVIATPNATTYDSIRWSEDLDTFGNISVQTRSGGADTRDTGVSFNGEDAYLQADSNYDFTTEDFSISFWLNPAAYNGSILVSNGQVNVNGYYIQLYSGRIGFYTFQSGVNQVSLSSPGSISLNEWQYITVTRSGSTATIYKNGVDITSTHGTHTDPVTTTQPFAVGVYPLNPALVPYLNGSMDDLQVWEKALNTTEITASMSGLTGSETDLVGYWQLDEMTGTKAYDLSSTNNDITLNGASWTQFADWEEWKPYTNGTDYTLLESADTHTNWTGTNTTVAEGDVSRAVKFFEDENEYTVTNTTKLTSSTDGGYAETTISATDISSYDYLTFWVRASEVGNVIKVGIGESAGNEQEENITIDTTGIWQKVYWDLSDIADANIDGITKIRITNLTTASNTIYIDNFRAESTLNNNDGSPVTSTPNSYFQYRVIFTTTNLSYQPKLENIVLSYNSGYEISIYDEDSVRLYNYSGSEKYLKLDVATVNAGSGSGFGSDGIAVSEVGDGTDAIAFVLNTFETFSTPSSKLLSVMNNDTEMMYLDSEGNLYVAGTITAGEGIGTALTNNSGGTVAKRSLVTIDPTSSNAFTTTTAENAKGAFGVVQGVEISNDVDKDGNCDDGDRCLVVFEGVTTVNTVDAVSASVGEYVYSSTTAGSAKAEDSQSDGMIGIVTSTANAASGYLSIVFDAQNKVTADMYVNGLMDQALYKDMYSQLASDYASMTLAERRGDLEDGSDAVIFDTFLDDLKMDSTLSSVGLDSNNNMMGLWGETDIDSSTTDSAGNRYLGSATATLSTSYYYDRTQSGEQSFDSTAETLVDLGIDPYWYAGVSLETSCTKNCSENSNLSTTYNGYLLDVSGTYGVSSEHGYITVKVTGQTISGITANIASSDGTCSVSGASLTFGEDYSFTAGSCSGSDITINPLKANYNTGDSFKIASWLVEPTTANDRGEERVFPEKSIIIGSQDAADIYLTIVNADTQKVWMRFASASQGFAGANMLVDSFDHSISSVYAMNGQIYVGGNHGGAAYAGAHIINFSTDESHSPHTPGYYAYQGSIGERQDANAYALEHTGIKLISSEVFDVHANVVFNKPTQEVTVSGWGYIQGSGGAQMGEGIAFPYEFNTNPNFSIVDAGSTSAVPSSISDCNTPTATYYTVEGEDVTTSSAAARVLTTDGNNLPTTRYYCYSWEATGTVSPQMYSVWGTGTSTADGGITIVNESKESAINVMVGSQYADNLYNTNVFLTDEGTLYDITDDSSASTANIDVYYGVGGMTQSETSIAQYRDIIYHVSAISPSGVNFLGSGNESVIDLWVTKGADGNNDIYIASTSGLTVLQEKQSGTYNSDGNEESNGTVKYYTKDYISEYMIGDTRGMWPLNYDNSSSDNEDVSGFANNLTAVNIESGDAVSGVRGTAVDFDGSTEYLYRADDTDFESLSEFTVSAWIKTTTNGMVVSKFNQSVGGTFWLAVSSGKANFLAYNGGSLASTLSGTSTITDGNWHFIVGQLTSEGQKIYVDGQLEGSDTETGTTSDTSSSIAIGAYFSTGTPTNFFTGTIDELTFIAESLTPTQIQKMYDSGKKALEGSHGVDDSYNSISGSTDDIRSILVTPDEKYMYVGTEGYGISKIDLTSDSRVGTYTTSTDPSISTDNAENISGIYSPRFVGDIGSTGMIVGLDSDGNDDGGTYYSRTFTLTDNASDAYLWLTGYLDGDDSSSDITVSVSNNGGSTYTTGTLINTKQLTNGLTQYEYSFDFTTSSNQMKVKIDLARSSSLNSSVYITEWGLAKMNVTTGTGNGMFTATDGAIPDGGYLEVVHGQNSYEVLANGWVYDTNKDKWISIDESHSVISASDASLVAYYNMDEASGSLIDGSSNSYNLLANGATSYEETGVYGTSISFDGVDDSFSCSDATCNFEMTDSLTVGGWVKGAENSVNGTEQTILAKWGLEGSEFDNISSWSHYDAGANGVGTDPDGYQGAVFDGRYIYYTPDNNGTDRHGEILRYDTQENFDSTSSWTTYDPGANGVGTDPEGFAGGVYDGRYIYFVPYNNGTETDGEVLRYDTQADFETASSWITYDPGANGVGIDPDGFQGGVYDGRYVYFVPYHNGTDYSGEVLRYDSQADFSTASSWATYDAGDNGVGTDPEGFMGAVFDGQYIYFVPYYNGTEHDGEVLRYNTHADFETASSWSAYDAGANGVGTDPDGFAGGVFDGRYIYFVPRYSGASYEGEVLRYDTQLDFETASSWTTYDAGANGVGTDPDGYNGAIFDGRYVYFIPFNNGTANHGEVLRYDSQGSFDSVSSWTTYDANYGDGYIGGISDGRYIYFSPHDSASSGDVLRYDTLADDQATRGSYKLTYSKADEAGGRSSTPYGPTLTINTASGAYSVSANMDITDGDWHQIVGSYDGDELNIYVDGQLAGTNDIPDGLQILQNGEDDFTIGSLSGESNSYFKGDLDEIFVYNRALSSAEVSEVYDGAAGDYEIQLTDPNTVRLYNYSGQTQNLRLDVIVGGSVFDLTASSSAVTLAPTVAQTDFGTNTNSIWINKMGTGGNLLKLQTNNVDMFVVDSDGNLDMAGDASVLGGTISLGSVGDQGSIRYNEDDDVLEFTNDGTTWLVLGSSSKLVTLSAEYPGATFSADGSNNTGTMTSDSEGVSADSMNYYEWNSSELSLNDYDLRIRFTLPSDFESWGSSGGITLNYATESTNTASNKVDFYAYEESSATVDDSAETLASSVAGTWTTVTLEGTDLTDINAAGETCVLIIRMSSLGDNYVRIGDIEFNYERTL